MADKIKVVIKRPYEPVGRMIDIPNTIETFQRQVGGNVESIKIGPSIAILCDEDGRTKGPQNNVTRFGVFAGTILFVGVSKGQITGFPGDFEVYKRMCV